MVRIAHSYARPGTVCPAATLSSPLSNWSILLPFADKGERQSPALKSALFQIDLLEAQEVPEFVKVSGSNLRSIGGIVELRELP